MVNQNPPVTAVEFHAVSQVNYLHHVVVSTCEDNIIWPATKCAGNISHQNISHIKF